MYLNEHMKNVDKTSNFYVQESVNFHEKRSSIFIDFLERCKYNLEAILDIRSIYGRKQKVWLCKSQFKRSKS